MSRIGSSLQTVMVREIANNRTEMNDLQRKIASGKVANTYGGLGTDRSMSLALRQEKQEVAGFRSTIGLVQSRLSVMNISVDQLRKNAGEMSSQLIVSGYKPTDSGQTLAQSQAGVRLADTVDLLNTQIAGRSLFAGAKTDELPVAPPKELMDGVGGRAGFRQIMDERRQADVGLDGKGRLALSANGATGVSLREDVAGSPFGFKLDAVRSGLNGVTATGPTGTPPGLTVDFSATLPAPGQQIFISLDLPDGSKTELAMTATSGSPAEAGQFQIGTDAASTATNFQAALDSLLSVEADTSLTAASMQVAADNFFTSGTNKPQRVDGAPLGSATSLRDATATDTVDWYRGDKSDTPARESVMARIDNNRLVAYGARADEDAFSTMVKQFAILSAPLFDGSSENDQARYTAMTDRVRSNLSNSDKAKSIDRVTGELAIAQNSLNETDKQHLSSDNLLTNFLSDIETADINEAAVKLLSKQTQLQASYQVTSMLSKLSLANFL